MTTSSPYPSTAALVQSSPIRIPDVSPSLVDVTRRYVCAVVTLLWPFSSSTKSFSLLLSDPDFRLRHLNGQVKATFQGSGAEAVALSKVGIGDTVILGLDGVEWISHEAGGTPGKSINWELKFQDRVVLEVYRNSQNLYTVDHDIPRPSDTQAADGFAPSSSTRSGLVDSEQPGLCVGPNKWSSPAFSRRNRQSLGSLSASAFDPFAEEDGYVAGKGRKRTRFSRLSSEWTFAETPPSPTRTTTWDPFEDLDLEVSGGSESRATDAERDTEPLSDGVSDAHAGSVVSPTPNGAQAGIIENPSEPSFSDTRYSGLQDARAPKIVVQAEEQEVSVVHSDSGNVDGAEFNVEELRTSWSNNASAHMGSALPRSAVDEWASLIATADAAAAEPDVAESHATDTPRLRPVGSPGLPLVSPLNTRSATPTGDIHEHESVTGDRVAEERTFSPNQDVEMAVADLHTYHKPLSLPPTGLSESRPSTQLQGTLHNQPINHGAQFCEEEGEDLASPEAVPAGLAENTDSISSGEQQFEQTPRAADDRIVESGGSERDSGSMSADREDTWAEVDEALSGCDDPRNSSEGIGERSEDYYDEEETYQEEIESYQGSPDTDNEVSQESDGEYEFDDAAPPPVSQNQHPVATSHNSVIVLDSDDESTPGDGEEDIEQDEVENPVTDAEEQSEKSDLQTTSTPGDLELPLSYNSEPEETMEDYDSAEYEREAEDITHVHGELIEPVAQSLNDDVEVDVSSLRNNQREASLESQEPAREVYNKSFSFTPSTQDGRISEKGSPEEVVIDPQLFRMRESEPPQASPHKRPSGLSLDGSSSPPPPSGLRENSLLRGRSPAFMKNQPPTPVPSQDVVVSPSQQLQFSLEAFPALPTPQASQDITTTENRQDATNGEAKDGNEPNIKSRIHIFGSLQLQGSAGASEYRPEEEVQPEQESKPKVEPVTENNNKAAVETSFQSEFHSLDESQPEALSERHNALERETATKAQLGRDSEGARKSDSDASASQLEVSTSLETTLVPEISDESDKRKEIEAVQNVLQEGIENNETSFSKDNNSRKTIADPTLLSPYPTKISKIEPNRRATGLRTNLSYYAPLSTIVDHFNTLIDTVSIVISASQPIRATSGARDYYTTIQVTDGSLGGRTTPAQIFRRYKRAIPRPIEGDVILLRDFKVCAFNHSMMLQAVKSSSWALFDQGKPDNMRCPGPPVEVGEEEKTYVTELRKLYAEGVIATSERGSIPTSRASTGTFSTASSESGATDNPNRGGSTPKRPRRGKSSRSRRITIHELRHGRRYTDVGSGSDKDSIHELRDGTLYMNP